MNKFYWLFLSLIFVLLRKDIVLAQSNICGNFTAQKIYPVPTANQLVSCPGSNSRVIYVSTLGTDNNNGLSANSPIKSLSKAISLTRRNSPDWIVLKRGETFNDSFGVLAYRAGEQPLGGNLVESPMVITSYGESTKRPIVQPGKNSGIDLWGSFRNITISGLEFRQQPGQGGIAIRTLYEGTNYVIHNNYIDGFALAINLQGQATNNQWFRNTIIKDNILVNSASSGEGHSQAIFAQDYQVLSITGNVIDTCGWYKDRNGKLADSRAATIFNHCIYLQSGSDRATIRENIITRASSHGLQARSGALVEANVFARNPIQMFISSKGYNGISNKQAMVARNNVVLEGNDINDLQQRGTGIQHNNAYNAYYENNIIAHLLSPSKYNKNALDIVCRTDDVHTSITDECKSNFSHNFIYNWGNELGGSLINTNNYKNSLVINHTLQENSFIAINNGIKFVTANNEILNNRYNFAGNTYISNYLTVKNMFSLPGQPNVSFFAWKENAESRAVGKNQISFVDPCRTFATYYDDFVLGNTKSNCQIMHDDILFEKFIDLAKQKNTMTGNSGINVNSFINYVKEGFVESSTHAN
ncbi:hypothetical protein NIES4102_01240 [Chondrocystis sp. NIES-4102]|nr:hypothetical protein NIES4102_01240 [Chondrocystis sp. NIES-4102]